MSKIKVASFFLGLGVFHLTYNLSALRTLQYIVSKRRLMIALL